LCDCLGAETATQSLKVRVKAYLQERDHVQGTGACMGEEHLQQGAEWQEEIQLKFLEHEKTKSLSTVRRAFVKEDCRISAITNEESIRPEKGKKGFYEEDQSEECMGEV
jgi:hypothetical protein